MASREGLDYHTVNHWNNQHPLIQQTEWSDVPDDTEYEVPGLPSPEVGPQGISLPLNPRENYRIKRALLRYELFCALFYLGPDRHFDTRHHPHRFNYVPRSSRRHAFRKEQVLFFKQYVNPWEIGELAVVTHFMYDLVRCVNFGAKSCPLPSQIARHVSRREGISSLAVLHCLIRPPKAVSLKEHADSENLLGVPTFTSTSPCAMTQRINPGLGAGAGDDMAKTDIMITKRWLMSLTTMWSGSPARVWACFERSTMIGTRDIGR